MHLLLNYLVFQVGWFAAVWGGANYWPWLGTSVAVAVVALHLYVANRPNQELKLLGIAALIGAFWDSLLVATGWLTYPSGTLIKNFAPHWIVAMWIMFATTLNVSLRWLQGRWTLAMLLGSVAGPLAYYGGSLLGGVQLNDLSRGMGALALGWAILTPLMLGLAQRFNGFHAPSIQPRYT